MTKQTINGVDYMTDSKGCLVPVEQIRPIDLARDELVREKVAKAKELQQQLRTLKYELLDDIEAFLEMSAERYDVKLGGKKGNVSLLTFDGRYQLSRQISEHLTFDEGLQAAKALIDHAFQVDKEGRINTGRILGLRRLNITDERWQRAMTAIGDSLQVTGTRVYVRVSERDANGKYTFIPLDMAAL